MNDSAKWIPVKDGWFDTVICSKCHMEFWFKKPPEECPGCKRKMVN